MLNRAHALKNVPDSHKQEVWRYVSSKASCESEGIMANREARLLAEEYYSELPEDLSKAVRCPMFGRLIDAESMCGECGRSIMAERGLSLETCRAPDSISDVHAGFFGFLRDRHLFSSDSTAEALRNFEMPRKIDRDLEDHRKDCKECGEKFEDFEAIQRWFLDDFCSLANKEVQWMINSMEVLKGHPPIEWNRKLTGEEVFGARAFRAHVKERTDAVLETHMSRQAVDCALEDASVDIIRKELDDGASEA